MSESPDAKRPAQQELMVAVASTVEHAGDVPPQPYRAAANHSTAAASPVAPSPEEDCATVAAMAREAEPKKPQQSETAAMMQPGYTASDGPAAPGLGTPGLGCRALLVIFMLASYPPITMEIYIPSLPSLQSSLHTSAANVLLTLSVFSGAFSLLQIVLGPISDVAGRRGLLLFGLLVYSAAAYGGAAAVTVEQMLPARVLQAFGSAIATIVSQAMLRDVFQARARETAMSRLALVRSSWVVLSPVLGSLLDSLLGWRSAFLFLAALGHLSFAGAFFLLPETLPRTGHQLRCSPRALLRANCALLGSRHFMCYAVPEAVGFGALFVWISTSSFILQNFYGLPVSLFGPLYTISFLGALAGSYASPRLRARFELAPAQLFLGGSLLGAAACVTLLGFSASELALQRTAASQAFLQACLLVYTFTVALTGVQAQVQALEPFPALAATAAGLMGAKRSAATCFVAIASGSLISAQSDDPRNAYRALCALGLAKPLLHLLLRPRAPPQTQGGADPADGGGGHPQSRAGASPPPPSTQQMKRWSPGDLGGVAPIGSGSELIVAELVNGTPSQGDAIV